MQFCALKFALPNSVLI